MKLRTRYVRPGDWNSEEEISREGRTVEIDKKDLALILVDLWSSHPNRGYLERTKRHARKKIRPLLDLMRDNEIEIIYACGLRDIIESVRPTCGELEICHNRPGDMFALLEEKEISTLLYGGYALNKCVMNRRATGMRALRYKGYDIILVRDCTLAMESKESIEEEWHKRSTIFLVESWEKGSTTTLKNLQGALR